MSKFKSTVFEDVKKTLIYWKENSELKLPDVTVEDFEILVNSADKKIDFISRESQKIKEAQKERDELFLKAQEITLRVKKMVIAMFGSDSKETKEIGLVPKSERKPRKRIQDKIQS